MVELKLKVMEALQEEAYKGIVRIDSQTMKEIGVHPGDVVEIEGSRLTVGIVDRAYPTDVGQNIIRMDGILRRNAKTGIGENVKVKKADIKEAKQITIAPAQKGVMVRADSYLFKKTLLGRAMVTGDIIVPGGSTRRRRTMSDSPFFDDIFSMFEDMPGSFGLGSLRFMVVSTIPKSPVIITENTEVVLSPKAVEITEEKIPEVTYEDIGGLSEEITKIREMVELPLKHPEIFNKLGIEPPKGVLLHGPPGTGKTLLAKAVANESEANFILVNGPELVNKFYGESEKRVREIFENAEKQAPSIIFFDEIDAIAPKREETYGELERRMVSQLLGMMDGLKSRGKVIVIAATNRPNSIDPALRRPGRFDREVSISAPNKEGRLNILKIHARNMPLAKDVNLIKLAEITHGFVGADVAALCKEAAMNVLRRVLPDLKLGEKDEIPKEVLEKLIVNDKDFREALKLVRPSALREVLIETPNVKWEDVGGAKEIQQELKEAIEWPLKHPTAFKRIGVKAPKGILLYGPPGTGKTLLAKAVATKSESNFILVRGPELLNKFVGESEKGVRKVFEKARQASPTILFFDELDSLAPKRGGSHDSQVTERVVNTLLSEMDGLEELNDVIVLAATNRPDMIDPALLRPGRFDRLLFVDAPSKEERLEILKVHTKNMPLTKDVNLNKLAEKTEGYTGADLEAIAREAGLLALRKDIKAKEVSNKFFEEALKKVRPSVNKELIEKYKAIEENYLRQAKAAITKEIPSYMG